MTVLKTWDEALAEAIRRAEREACAFLAESFVDDFGSAPAHIEIARRIRSRSSSPAPAAVLAPTDTRGEGVT